MTCAQGCKAKFRVASTAQKADTEKAATRKAYAEKADAEKADAEKAAAEKAAAEKAAAEKVAAEKAVAEKKFPPSLKRKHSDEQELKKAPRQDEEEGECKCEEGERSAPWSRQEELSIIQYFTTHGGYWLSKGLSVWDDMLARQVCPGRSATGMRQHWKGISGRLEELGTTRQQLRDCDPRCPSRLVQSC